jgi:pimeloyl-ACP methyl ester carboxylesterase
MARKGLFALAGTAFGVGAGLVAQRSMVNRRRRNDPEAGEPFGKRRGDRSMMLARPDGAQLFIEETGPDSKTGIVFMHGSALRTDVWHYQMPAFEGRRMIFFDLRGHGLSQPKGEAAYTIPTLADDLEAVIDAAGVDEIVIVGHSIGGMVALDYAIEHQAQLGSRVKGLVLTNTTHRPAYETTIGGAALSRFERVARNPLDALGNYHESVERLRRIIKPTDQVFLAVSVAAFGPRGSAKQIDFTYDMLAETPSDVIFDLFRAYRDFDVSDRLGDVTVPVLVITGTHDRLTVSKASDFLAEHLPKAELKVLQGSGHMTMLERHRDFNKMLETFFKDVLGPVNGD